MVLSCLCTCLSYCDAKHMTASWELTEGSWLADSLQFGSKFCSVAAVRAVTSRSDISCSHCIVYLSTAFHVCHCLFAGKVTYCVDSYGSFPNEVNFFSIATSAAAFWPVIVALHINTRMVCVCRIVGNSAMVAETQTA